MKSKIPLYSTKGKVKSYKLKVDKLHTLHIEESGNSKGIPVICLHGGPGAPMGQGFRKVWDPKKFKIITFHQRGCGKSTPKRSLVRNTTKYQYKDIEAIRKFFKIKKWIVEGGSWGATLAVLYSIKYPKRVIALIAFGVSLFDRIIEGSTRVNAPDVYHKWKQGKKSDSAMMKFYLKKLTSKNKATRLKYARLWNVEGKLFELMNFENYYYKKKKKRRKFKMKTPEDEVVIALFECYYYMNGAFEPKGYMLKNAHKLNKIPGYIIHGRYDIICNPEGAFKLSKKWTKAKLIITEMSGHSGANLNNVKAMKKAADSFKRFYKKRRSFYCN